MAWPVACLASYLTGVTINEELMVKSFQFRNTILSTYSELIGCKNLTHETGSSLCFCSVFAPLATSLIPRLQTFCIHQ